MKRAIGFFAFNEFQLLDLSGPLAAFEVAGRIVAGSPYDLRVLSVCGGPIRSSSGLEVSTTPVADETFDTLIVPGGSPCLSSVATDLAVSIREPGSRSRRLASVCTGAFVLAAGGLLEGHRVTTHWRHASALRQRYPRLRVDPEPLFIQDGRVWTATGTNAGIDLALAMIEEDFGNSVARATAQMMVVHQRRPGGQSQFAGLIELDAKSPRIRKVIDYARTHLHERLAVEDLAEIACLSPRQFSRLFVAEIGVAPAKALEHMRAEAARLRIETSVDSIDAISRRVGFADPERMRRTFIRIFGQPPQAIRRSLRAA